MSQRAGRPSPLSGLWVLLGGGVLWVLAYAWLEHTHHWIRFLSVHDSRDCPNSTGDGGPFAAGELELGLLALGFVWLLLVLVEQLLPWTWRNRHPLTNVVRGAGAVLLASLFFCYLPFGLALVCS